MSPGATATRVYEEIRRRLLEGHFVAGQRLEPAKLGEGLFASITPVRDALHRLVGERLVEASQQDGFRVPVPNEAQLRDLYAWRAKLHILALNDARKSTGMRVDMGDMTACPLPLFEALTQLPANHEHRRAIAAVEDRLACLRGAELTALSGQVPHHDDMRMMVEASDWQQLRAALTRYHHATIRAVPAILALYRGDAPDG